MLEPQRGRNNSFTCSPVLRRAGHGCQFLSPGHLFRSRLSSRTSASTRTRARSWRPSRCCWPARTFGSETRLTSSKQISCPESFLRTTSRWPKSCGRRDTESTSEISMLFILILTSLLLCLSFSSYYFWDDQLVIGGSGRGGCYVNDQMLQIPVKKLIPQQEDVWR